MSSDKGNESFYAERAPDYHNAAAQQEGRLNYTANTPNSGVKCDDLDVIWQKTDNHDTRMKEGKLETIAA